MFFFFKQKTAYEMRISDWSSDVCSSDLKRRKPSQHAEEQGVSATRWRRPLPEGRNRAKMTPKRFMDETSRTDAGLRLTPRRGKLLIRLQSAARSLAKTDSGLNN